MCACVVQVCVGPGRVPRTPLHSSLCDSLSDSRLSTLDSLDSLDSQSLNPRLNHGGWERERERERVRTCMFLYEGRFLYYTLYALLAALPAEDRPTDRTNATQRNATLGNQCCGDGDGDGSRWRRAEEWSR